MENVAKFKRCLNNKWNGAKPLAKLIKTNNHGYLYDAGTNKILKCDDAVFDLLEKIFSTKTEQAIDTFWSVSGNDRFTHASTAIIKAMETQKVLATTSVDKFGLSDHYRNFENLINSSLEILFLELTERCNLNCSYCIYNCGYKNRRNHGTGDMTREVAYKAIDYLNHHSFKRDKVAISFYGGEPLLRFPAIKECVQYANSVIKKREITFSITTNSALITPEIADYFKKNNFFVYVSIDGPRDIHDTWRIDQKGKGSYKNTIRGLKNLIDVYGATAVDKVGLSMVYTPPFSSQRLDRIAAIWEELEWLPKELKISITYPSPGSIPATMLKEGDLNENMDLQQWAYEKYLNKYAGHGASNPIADTIMERRLAQLMQRPVFKEPFEKYYLNGCCVPGVKRLYTSTSGNLHVCERISSYAPLIGNLYSDKIIDIDLIKNIFIDEYEKISLPICSGCWAIRLCSSCYTDAFNEGKLDMETKKNNCFYLKKSHEKFLSYFCSLLELKEDGLDYLYNYNFT